jgi:phosphoesterase RecJ-like protein
MRTDRRGDLKEVAAVLKEGRSFILATHKDPDADGVGSMLALSRALKDAGKDTLCVSDGALPGSLNLLAGAEEVLTGGKPQGHWDACIVLDCSAFERIAGLGTDMVRPLVNIDHHETNDRFGDYNLVERHSSSTGEIVLKLIKAAGLSMCYECAENIFAAIQSDTGSFKYTNTTPQSLHAAIKLIRMGVRPWDTAMRIMDGCLPSRLELLRMGLGTISFHSRGRIGLMVLTREMFERAGADFRESERFVDYPRCVRGVQIAVLVRQMKEDLYKFSLRSNSTDRVAELARIFGGGGHARAAAFESRGPLEDALDAFLKEAERFLHD